MAPVTDEETWISFLRTMPAWLPPSRRTIVIAPHPDDETLGAGGLIASRSRLGLPVLAIAVTDGEAAYTNNEGLAMRRCVEQENALVELGVPSENIIRLRLPDSAVAKHEEKLVQLLLPLIEPGDLLIAPWAFDPHPDHEACGRAAEAVAHRKGATLVSYIFWTWHWKQTDFLADVPLRRFTLDQHSQAAKSRALAHHVSQLEHESGAPILPDILLAPARRHFETFISYE